MHACLLKDASREAFPGTTTLNFSDIFDPHSRCDVQAEVRAVYDSSWALDTLPSMSSLSIKNNNKNTYLYISKSIYRKASE